MATANSILVLNYLKNHYGEEMTKHQIAEELGIGISSVIGAMNSFIKKGYAKTTREETVVDEPATETRKAKTRVVKYHTLTEAGLAYDPVEEEARKAAEKEAAKAAKAAAKAAE